MKALSSSVRVATRCCSTSAPTSSTENDFGGVPEAEYWKTAAHYYQERLQSQQLFTGQCARMSQGFDDAAKGWQYWDMDTYSSSTLSYEDFFNNNSKSMRPCVITGLKPHPTEWNDYAHWEKELDDTEVAVSVFNPSAQRGMQVVENTTFKEYVASGARRSGYPEGTIEDWEVATAKTPAPLKTAEVVLPSSAPWMLENFVVPKYFAQDLLQFAHQNTILRAAQVDNRDELEEVNPRAALPALYLDDDLHVISSAPKVTFSPRGAQSGLHHAPFHHHQWLTVARGSMDVMVFASDFTPCLYEEEFCTYALDAFEPDFEAFPSAIMAYPWRVTLNEGDTLFVPADYALQWRAMQDSVVTTMPFVDWGNVETAVFDAERMAGCGNPAFLELTKGFNMRFLSSPQCARTSEPLDTPYGAYLTWRNDSEVADTEEDTPDASSA